MQIAHIKRLLLARGVFLGARHDRVLVLRGQGHELGICGVPAIVVMLLVYVTEVESVNFGQSLGILRVSSSLEGRRP